MEGKNIEKAPNLGIDRRDLLKIGVGAGVSAAAIAAATPLTAMAQSAGPAVDMAGGQTGSPAVPAPGKMPLPSGTLEAPYGGYEPQYFPNIIGSKQVIASVDTGYSTRTMAGWTNKSNRASGNGPMDESTRRIVEWVDKFSFSDITPACLHSINNTLIDTLATMYCGFESEPARISARICAETSGPCTVMGYGIKSDLQNAAFNNSLKIRHADFDGPHNNEMFGPVFAVGELLKSPGKDMLVAFAICYEIVAALGNTGRGNYDPAGWDCPYHGPAAALAVGKLWGMNQDKLANAFSLALVPHMPMYVCHIGTQSMWKGTHSSEVIRNGLWGAMLAQGGMTGPCMPIEGRDGLFRHVGAPTHDLRLPTSPDGRLGIETVGHGVGNGFKRYPSEGSTQLFWEHVATPLHQWTKPDEVASIDVVHTYFAWQEICDPPKFDPRNRETADHSMPFNIALAILDGEVWIDSFVPEKYLSSAARGLMDKMTFEANLDPTVQNTLPWVTVTKKSGEKRTFKAKQRTSLSQQDLLDKYQKCADYRGIDKAQSAQALKEWTSLDSCPDVSGPIKTLAKFGNPRPLSDMSPAKIS